LAHKDVEDAIAAVGRGELSSLDVLRAVFPDFKDERVTVKPAADEGWFNMRSASGMMFKLPERPKLAAGATAATVDDYDALPIRGLSANVPVRFAPSGAVPGDRIVGIVDKDSGITIYPIQAPALQKFDDQPERWIDVRWDLDEANKARFPARIEVNTLNEPGTLATVAQTIGGLDINIRGLKMGSNRAADFSEIEMEVEVWDVRQLNQLISQMKDLDCVSNLKRIYD
jgi:GTP diphosphokinase / guanosine-3',5'-bis(diphosphate) 3'-diphosphatase